MTIPMSRHPVSRPTNPIVCKRAFIYDAVTRHRNHLVAVRCRNYLASRNGYKLFHCFPKWAICRVVKPHFNLVDKHKAIIVFQ